jgi:hypothetical protein
MFCTDAVNPYNFMRIKSKNISKMIDFSIYEIREYLKRDIIYFVLHVVIQTTGKFCTQFSVYVMWKLNYVYFTIQILYYYY